MDQIANALQGELRQTLDRLRDLGGAVVFEDYPGALEAGDDGEVGGDSVNASEERELSFTVRGRLVERANRLAEALDRLRSGEYGACQACGNQIAAARLRAMPENREKKAPSGIFSSFFGQLFPRGFWTKAQTPDQWALQTFAACLNRRGYTVSDVTPVP